MADDTEPRFLQDMRACAVQRRRTTFVKAKWSDIQDLLRERDALWALADQETRDKVASLRRDYAGNRPGTASHQYRAGRNVIPPN